MLKIIGKYKNGNVFTSIFSDGTKIRYCKDNDFKSDFAENIDIKIINKCSGTECKFCHEGSGPNGKVPDILHLKFIDSLHPYQEVALGGGNVLEHPDLIPFLEKLKEKKVIANITLHQTHFSNNFKLVQELVERNLVTGVGVSLILPTDDLIQKIQKIPNCVIHIINGIVTKNVLKDLYNKNLKILILGYKRLRRGEIFYQDLEDIIKINQNYLKNVLKSIIKNNKFQTISFDNLAIEQLGLKNILNKDKFDTFYMGDEGSNTFYIDCVTKTFAISSTASMQSRYPLLDSVDDMFNYLKTK